MASDQRHLRVLAERGELNQLELSQRVGVASQTAVTMANPDSLS